MEIAGREINKESVAKVVKAACLIAGVMGYKIEPEQLQAIAEFAGGAVTVVYLLEAWWKTRKR